MNLKEILIGAAIGLAADYASGKLGILSGSSPLANVNPIYLDAGIAVALGIWKPQLGIGYALGSITSEVVQNGFSTTLGNALGM